MDLPECGDANQGYAVEGHDDTVFVRAWGFWSAEFALGLVPAVMAALVSRGKNTALIVDLDGLRPLRDEGQSAFRELMRRALSHGVREFELRHASALTKLQMLRLARELGLHDQIRVT